MIGIQWDPPPLSLKQPAPAPDLDGDGNGGLLKACEKLVRSAREHPVGEGGWEVSGLVSFSLNPALLPEEGVPF